MTFLSKGIKQYLQHVAIELGIQGVQNLRVIELKNAIVAIDGYEEEFVKGYLDSIHYRR